MTESLPNVGDLNWGPTLNNYITDVVLSEAQTAETTITSHQTANDPHGDRAYASSLVSALSASANTANNFVQLNGSGKIPNSLVNSGGITNIFDAVSGYNADPTGATDTSTAINNALAAASAAGGGEVWLADGTFAIGSTLVIGANTWLHLSPGATVKRIANPGVPTYMLANFNGNNTPGTGNILVSGGAWTVGSTTQACVPMAFINAQFVAVEQTIITNTPNSSANVMFAGCSQCVVSDVLHLGSQPSSRSSSSAAVRIEASASNVISGLNVGFYTGSGCTGVAIRYNSIAATTNSDGNGPYTMFGYYAATFSNSGTAHNNILMNGNYCNALAQTGVISSVSTWNYFTATANQFQNAGSTINTAHADHIPIADTNTIPLSGFTAYYPVGGNTGRSNQTSLQNDPYLSLTSLDANTVYQVTCVITYNGGGGGSAGYLKWAWAIPSGASWDYTTNFLSASSGNPLITTQSGTDSSQYAYTSGVSNNLGLTMNGILYTSSAGSLTFQWAQQSSSGTNTHVLEGSFVCARRIG